MFSFCSSRPFFLLLPFFSVFLSFFLDSSGPVGPRATTRFLTKLLMRICCCILLMVSFFYLYFPSPLPSQLPFDRRIFAWTLSWLLFPDASLVTSFVVFNSFHMLLFNVWVHTTGLGASQNVAYIFGGSSFFTPFCVFIVFPLDLSSFSSHSLLYFFPSS